MIRDQPPSRYPPGFDNWPVERRLDYMDLTYTREGLIRVAFSLAGYQANRQIDNQTRLTIEGLAAIVLALDPDPETLRIDSQ